MENTPLSQHPEPQALTPAPISRNVFIVGGIILFILFAAAVLYGVHARSEHDLLWLYRISGIGVTHYGWRRLP